MISGYKEVAALLLTKPHVASDKQTHRPSLYQHEDTLTAAQSTLLRCSDQRRSVFVPVEDKPLQVNCHITIAWTAVTAYQKQTEQGSRMDKHKLMSSTTPSIIKSRINVQCFWKTRRIFEHPLSGKTSVRCRIGPIDGFPDVVCLSFTLEYGIEVTWRVVYIILEAVWMAWVAVC